MEAGRNYTEGQNKRGKAELKMRSEFRQVTIAFIDIIGCLNNRIVPQFSVIYLAKKNTLGKAGTGLL